MLVLFCYQSFKCYSCICRCSPFKCPTTAPLKLEEVQDRFRKNSGLADGCCYMRLNLNVALHPSVNHPAAVLWVSSSQLGQTSKYSWLSWRCQLCFQSSLVHGKLRKQQTNVEFSTPLTRHTVCFCHFSSLSYGGPTPCVKVCSVRWMVVHAACRVHIDGSPCQT